MPKAAAKPNTTRIAVNPAGTFLVHLGRKAMIAMESNVRPPKTRSSSRTSHAPLSSLNWATWLPPMMMAKPLTNPKITGCGTKRMSFPSFISPARSCRTPASTTVAKMYSGPWEMANAATTTATAPVAPLIMPGRPPNTLATRPTTKAAYSPVSGLSPAISAKATASGMRAMATVKPLRTSRR